MGTATLEVDIARRHHAAETARARSGIRNATVTIVCALVAIASDVQPSILNVTRDDALRLVLGVLGATAITQAVYMWRGAASLAFRLLWGFEGLVQMGALATLIERSGSAASPLWAVAMAWSVRWTPAVIGSLSLGMLQAVPVLGGLVGVYASRGDWASVIVTASVLTTMLSMLHASTTSSTRILRLTVERTSAARQLAADALRRERDLLARELHDDVCANVVALILELRRRESQGDRELAAQLGQRARHILDALRASIRWLRMDDGGFAELQRALEADATPGDVGRATE